MKERKVGIIGMGWVGASVAISLLHTGVVDELYLNDIETDVAEGEAMDLSHGSSFYPQALVRESNIGAMRDCDLVVIAAGRGGKNGESRLDLLRDNARIISDIAGQLKGFDGIAVVVSNPVDVLTQVFYEASGLPAERVIGTGTMLDTARLRDMIGKVIDIEPKSIHAQVIGEHGDSEVVLWSGARVGSRKLWEWEGWDRSRESEITEKVRKAAYEIIRRKGATNHAIGLVTAHLVKWIFRDERRVLSVSRYHPEYKTAVSLPVIVGNSGATTKIQPEMSPEEEKGFEHSVEVLQEAYQSL